MLLIRGDTRVADIYMTEFDRIFRHFYFRDNFGTHYPIKVISARIFRAGIGRGRPGVRAPEPGGEYERTIPGAVQFRRRRIDPGAGCDDRHSTLSDRPGSGDECGETCAGSIDPDRPVPKPIRGDSQRSG